MFAAVLDAGEDEISECLRARVQTCEREAVVKTLAARASGEWPSDSADRPIAC